MLGLLLALTVGSRRPALECSQWSNTCNTCEQMHQRWSTCEWLLRKPPSIVQNNPCNSLRCHAHSLSILWPSINAQGHICRSLVNFTVKTMFLHFSPILHNEVTPSSQLPEERRQSVTEIKLTACFTSFEWPKFESWYHSPCSHYLRGFKHLCHLKKVHSPQRVRLGLVDLLASI